MKTILVTGGAGYIGSHASLLLSQSGYHVIILDSLVYNQPHHFAWATFINGDCSDKKLLEKIFSENKIEAVMHFAAFIQVGESVKDPLKFYDNNVANTITLLETMRKHNCDTFIFSSSCAVYGNPHIVPIPEEHEKNPMSPYGTSKLMVEIILQDAHIAYGLNYVCLRYFNAAGALPEYNLGEYHIPETHVIPLLLTAAQEQKPFYIFGDDYDTPDGTCIRDFLHVWDIAHAHLYALEHLKKGNPSDAFNLGTGNGISIQQLIDTVQKITNKKIEVKTADRRPGDPSMLIANASKAHDVLRWKPQFSDIEFIIKSAYQAKQ